MKWKENKDEYLSVSMVAYLLGRGRSAVQQYCVAGDIRYEVTEKGMRMIRLSELHRFIWERWGRALEYFDTEDKQTFWKEHNGTKWMDGYLTMVQAAWLLKVSVPNIHYLYKKGYLPVENVGRKKKLVVPEKAMKEYVEKKVGKNAIEYFNTDDRYRFWESHSYDFYVKISQNENKRSNRYYHAKQGAKNGKV